MSPRAMILLLFTLAIVIIGNKAQHNYEQMLELDAYLGEVENLCKEAIETDRQQQELLKKVLELNKVQTDTIVSVVNE